MCPADKEGSWGESSESAPILPVTLAKSREPDKPSCGEAGKHGHLVRAGEGVPGEATPERVGTSWGNGVCRASDGRRAESRGLSRLPPVLVSERYTPTGPASCPLEDTLGSRPSGPWSRAGLQQAPSCWRPCPCPPPEPSSAALGVGWGAG